MPEYTKAGVGYGIGAGAGRFSEALRDVLLSGQQRKSEEEERRFRSEQAGADEAFRRDSLGSQQSYQESSLALEQQRIEEARAGRESSDLLGHLERGDRLRASGFDTTTPSGGSFSEAMTSVLQGREGGPPIAIAGDYDPTRDVGLTRERELVETRGNQDRLTVGARAAAESSPGSPQTFTKNGMRFPYTQEGVDSSRAFDAELSGDAADDERRSLVIQGARMKMTDPETGEIDLSRLRDVVEEMRRRPNTTLEDIQYVQDFFAR